MTYEVRELKGFIIHPDGVMGYKKIKNTGSGAVPKELSGIYTNTKAAVDAINAYQPKRGAKKRNVETESTV